MRSFRLAVAVLGVVFPACSSGENGKGSESSGANASFCHDYNDAYCKRLFECTPSAEQKEPFFAGLFGQSAQDCTTRWTEICQKPTASLTPDVACPAGKTVNMQKASECLTKVKSVSCEKLDEAGTTDVCVQACGGTPSEGNGGASDGATSDHSVDGGGDDGPPASSSADIEKFCRDFRPLNCELIYACVPEEKRNAAFKQSFGNSVAECAAIGVAQCPEFAQRKCMFNREYAAQCLKDVAAVKECQLFEIGGISLPLPPATCLGACYVETP